MLRSIWHNQLSPFIKMYCNFSEKFKLIPSQVSRKGCAHFLFIGNRVAKAPGLNLATSLSNSINNREALSSQHFVCFASQKKDLYYNAMTRGGCRASETSKMECFVITVNGLKPLTIITKRSILDVAAALGRLWWLLLILPENRGQKMVCIFQRLR